MSVGPNAPKAAKGGAIPQRNDMSPLGTAGSNGEDSSPAAIRAPNRPCRICKGTGVAYDIVPGAGHGKRIGMKPVACDHCEGTGQEPEEKWPRFETLDTDELRKLALEGRRHGGFITSPGIVLSLLDEIERLKRMGS